MGLPKHNDITVNLYGYNAGWWGRSSHRNPEGMLNVGDSYSARNVSDAFHTEGFA